jgi:NAD(P)-dependent dehydrogenase (short-subunit alcohol dehydrogenase family)
MDLKLAGKTALISGASKGIGAAAAEMLAAEGCHLVLVARSPDDLARAKGSIVRKANVSVETVPADLSDSTNVTRLAREYPDIDILVNNAGAIPGGKLLDIDEATWRAAWDLKVFGYINMCRAFFAPMKARQTGVIINVIGNAAQTHDPDYICGVTGNAALTAFTQSLGSMSVRDGSGTGCNRTPGQPDAEKGAGSHRQCGELARPLKAAAVRTRRHRRGDRSRHCFSRLRAFRLHKRLGRHRRRWPVGPCTIFLSDAAQSFGARLARS